MRKRLENTNKYRISYIYGRGNHKSFGPGRVIIREGHVPQNFYLILSGTALVTKTSINKQTGEPFVRTAAFLKKGKTFGDVAILNGARRNATVLCDNTVSLLSVPRQDFINTFMSHEAKEEQNFITFLRKIEVLSGWPVENLPDSKPGICIHTFFRRNTVISRDTKASSKIYIIKTGTIRVLKTLTSTKPHLPGKPSSISGDRKYQNTDNQSEEMHAKKAVRAKTSLPSRKSSRDVEFLLPLLQQGPAALEERADTRSPYTSSATVPKEGLVYLLFEDTFGMTLISEGAECILISKDFFQKYTDDAYLCKLSKVVQPYPSEQALQKQLQEYINWSAYKSLLFNRPQKLCAISN
ncbi:cyclic nucleotide-binding domain-containing protein 2-like [Acipenser oxyrinchus oxyrinchus]|uniref:Cyclic nucleotide-binding domain-containing protein 2-like n=1 Tax=Acipenser oxyrinchus oxyrinchus TaxID=40147 RepID=A0AAD8CIF1_ACIOX|nr:cyclic nucleotide-binding domain-containing protein 2-like [Acipenser oxyrinchus oxyrinchus]